MKRTPTTATYHLQPTVYIDAVPELARQRDLLKERDRVRETNGDDVACDTERTAA